MAHDCKRLECDICWPALPEVLHSAPAPATPSGNFWDRIHDGEGAIRSKYQFREGDFTAGFTSLRRVLKSRGLWKIMSKGSRLSAGPSEKSLKEHEKMESWALDLAFPFICESIVERWSSKRPITGPQLLEFLEKTACSPFRLNDLPTELREHVYEHINCSIPPYKTRCTDWKASSHGYVLEVSDCYDAKNDLRSLHFERDYPGIMGFYTEQYEWCPIGYERTEDERRVCLSLVCREFRNFVEDRQFGRSEFDVRIHSGDLDHFLEWVGKIGVARLRRVRKMRVSIKWYKDVWDEISVSYDPVHGLKAIFEQDENRHTPPKTLTEYTSRISRRNIREEWNSTGVIECFTADPNGLRHACWGSAYVSGVSSAQDVNDADYYYDDDDDDAWHGQIDERNAYSVAYGHFEIRCMW